MKRMAWVVGALVGMALIAPTATMADTVIALDVGSDDSTLFDGTYDGTTGWVQLSTGMNGYYGGRDLSPSVTVGDVTITLNNVGMWGSGTPTGTDDSLALYYDFFHYADTSNTTFTISGLTADQTVTVEMLGSGQPFTTIATFNGGAAVQFGSANIESLDQPFTTIGSATGATSYSGTLTGLDGSEGDLGAIRLTIVPEPTTMAMLLVGGLAGVIRRKRRG